MTPIDVREHEHEPVSGLPGRLPEGEHILWQGAPDAALVARHVFAIRWIAGYFAVIAGWVLISGLYDGTPFAPLIFSVAIPAAFAAVVIGLAELYSWGVARTTLYTITNKRIAMRIGVALSMTFNLPFRQIKSAGLRDYKGGGGTIAITLKNDQRISWLRLWPHARPWRLARTEPALRCLRKADAVAEILAEALRDHAGDAAAVAPRVRRDDRPEGAARPRPASEPLVAAQ